jgi:hypothetical protein
MKNLDDQILHNHNQSAKKTLLLYDAVYHKISNEKNSKRFHRKNNISNVYPKTKIPEKLFTPFYI